MTFEEINRWIRENEAEVSWIEHIRGTPRFIAQHRYGYCQATAVIVFIVLILNIAFLWPTKNEA